MRMKNNILVVDTETVGGFGQPLVHDIGYAIVDSELNILYTYRALVSQPRSASWVMNSEFYKKYASVYEQEIEDGMVEIKSWQDIQKDLEKNIRKHKVNTLSAFNLAFDYRALNFTNQFLNNNNQYYVNVIDKKKMLCIWNLACETICDTEEYKKWCDKHKKKSDSGNYPTNAETVYQYITNNPDFKEDHTALSDVLIEVEILKYIKENFKGNVNYGLYYNCWRKAQG